MEIDEEWHTVPVTDPVGETGSAVHADRGRRRRRSAPYSTRQTVQSRLAGTTADAYLASTVHTVLCRSTPKLLPGWLTPACRGNWMEQNIPVADPAGRLDGFLLPGCSAKIDPHTHTVPVTDPAGETGSAVQPTAPSAAQPGDPPPHPRGEHTVLCIFPNDPGGKLRDEAACLRLVSATRGDGD